MSIAEVLKKLRREKGLTQEELSRILHINRSTLGMYESGKREPGFETLEIFADYYNVSMDVLRDNHIDSTPSTAPTSMPDAVKKLEEIKSYFSSAAALGEGMSEEDKALLLAAIEPTILQAKAAARKKFTPKKYRK